MQYQAEHSEAHTVVVEGEKQLLKYQNILDDKVNGGLPKLKVIVAYNMSPDAVDAQKPQFKKHNVQLFEWKEFLDVDGKKEHAGELDKRMADQKPGNCIKLIYTSGTTGRPKAVMISHDNMVWTSKMMANHMEASSILTAWCPICPCRTLQPNFGYWSCLLLWWQDLPPVRMPSVVRSARH